MLFNPCLVFQKMMTNIVYNGDVLVLSSTKAVSNRYPNVFCTYRGTYYDLMYSPEKENRRKYVNEVSAGKMWGSVEDQTKWQANIYRASDDDDKNEFLYAGDVISLHLSERSVYNHEILYSYALTQ